jgi:ribosome recycling factor
MNLTRKQKFHLLYARVSAPPVICFIMYDFSNLKKKIKDTEDWLREEYIGVRTGRATPALLDSIRVDSYGALVPVNQVASVSVEDARTLRVVPYEPSAGKAIEKAVTNASLGVSVSTDDKGTRIFFPELTSESRKALLKIVKEKLEHARVSLRTERDQTWEDIQRRAKDKQISEDDKFRFKDEMQKITNGAGEELERIAERKESEILS